MIKIQPANKKGNEYADTMPDLPKAVLMAIAATAYANLAFSLPKGDDGEGVVVGDSQMLKRIANEWALLHACGIVPQPVNREWRQYL